MFNNSKIIAFHTKGDKKHRTSHSIHPFVSLEIYRSGEGASTDKLSRSAGVGTAIITILISGESKYSDSTQKNVTLKKNDLIWSISGSGVSYSLNPKTNDYVSVQLAIALSPALEQVPAQSIHLESSFIEHEGPAQILLGRYGDARSGFALPALINYLMVTLVPGQSWTYEPPINHSVTWAAVVSGKIKTSNNFISQEETRIYENSTKPIEFFAEEESIFLIGSSVKFNNDLVLKDARRSPQISTLISKQRKDFAY